MKTSVKKNFIYNFAYQFLVMVVPFITAPYISRVLGAEKVGVFGYTGSISAIFILFGSAGTSLYGQRQIAFSQEDKETYSRTFWEIFVLRFIGIFLSLVVFFCSFVLRQNEYQIYYIVLMLELFGSMIDISWLFQGLEQFKITVLRNAIVKIVGVVAIFAFVKRQEDLLIYFMIYVLSVVLGNMSLWVNLPQYVKKPTLSKLQFSKHIWPIFKLFIPQVAAQIYSIFDKTMLGVLIADKSEVGYYDQSQKLVKTVLALVTTLGTVMLPRIANRYSAGDKEGIKEYMYGSFEIVAMISMPLAFGIAIVAESFVPWYFGIEFMPVVGIIRIIAPILCLIGISNVIGIQFLLPTKRETHYTISVVVGAVVNFTANLIFIPRFGAAGAAIGTVIAEFSVVVAQVAFTWKDWDYKKAFVSLLKYMVIACLMACVCIGVGMVFEPVFLCMVLQIIAGGFAYGLIAFLVVKKKVGTSAR